MFKMPILNQVVIAGRTTKEPELKKTNSGMSYAKFSIAVNNYYMKDGKWEHDTCYFSVTAWGNIAENYAKRAYKGAPMVITGRLSVSKWTDQQGAERSSVEIVAEKISVMEWKEAAEQTQQTQYSEGGDVPF